MILRIIYIMFKKQIVVCVLFIGLGCTIRVQAMEVAVKPSNQEAQKKGEELVRLTKVRFYPQFDAAKFQQLINEGADLTVKWGEYGETPLLSAIGQGHIEIEAVKMLLKAGADVNAVGSNKRDTPLIHAVNRSTDALEMVKLLLEVEGIKLDKKNAYNNTALFITFRNKPTNIALGQALIDAGANVNVRCERNNTTVLCDAARNSDRKWVQMVIAAGADVNLKYPDSSRPTKMRTIFELVTPQMKIYIEQLVKERKEREEKEYELPEKSS